MKVNGTVTNTYSKTKSTRVGDKTIHYIEVDDGNTVNVGFKQTFEVGEVVNLDVAEKYGELQIARGGAKGGGGSVKPTWKPSTSSSAPPRARGAFPIDPTDNQTSIVRQSSLNRAVDTATIMQQHGMFADDISQEELVDIILEMAYQYTDFSTGQREVKAARKMKEAASG